MPTTKECLDDVLREMRGGAAPLTIPDAVADALRAALEADFDRELRRGAWDSEGPLVLKVAHDVGVNARLSAGSRIELKFADLVVALHSVDHPCTRAALAPPQPDPRAEGRYCWGLLRSNPPA